MNKNKKIGRITILGPSGGGKGTQAKLLEEKYGWKHVSVGELFREEIAKGTKIGQEANEYVEKGDWVPTKLTFRMLRPVLENLLETGFVLDGFPRLPDQPKILDNFLEENGASLDMAIHLDIRPKVIMERRKKSWEEGKSFYDQKRKDETIQAIRSRIEEYQKTITPILNYYQDQGILFRVDGERPIEPIHQDIVSQIKENL